MNRTMPSVAVVALVAGFVFGMAPIAHAAVVDLYSVADAEITGTSAGSFANTSNWGGLLNLVGNVNRTGGPTSTQFPSSGDSRGLLRFDLSAIPAGATINSATVSIYINFNAFSPVSSRLTSVQLYQVTSAWTEMGVTYDTRPTWNTAQATSMSIPAGTGSGGSIPFNGYINGNVTNLVRDWYDGDAMNFGLQTSDTMIAAGLLRISARESGGDSTSQDPRLRVDYTPNIAPVAHAGNYGPLDPSGSVTLSGSGTDADSDAISGYSWDLNNDGVFGDSLAQSLILTYADAQGLWGMSTGDNTIQLMVMDEHGLWSTADAGIVTMAVPEPATMALLAFGGLGLIGRGIRRRGRVA